ncbi:MAG: FAD-binding protein [Firmicutes bacterium]|nr:FAD-binding protein [Bacillota bacterium]
MGEPGLQGPEPIVAQDRESADPLGAGRLPEVPPNVDWRAIPIVPGITFTMGGLAVNSHCTGIDVNGVPFPGLYAAGSACGGIHGGIGHRGNSRLEGRRDCVTPVPATPDQHSFIEDFGFGPGCLVRVYRKKCRVPSRTPHLVR